MAWVNRELLTSLIEKLPGGVAIVDSEYRYLVLNSSLAEINGVSITDTVGKTIMDVVPELADEVCGLIDNVLSTGKDKLNIRVEGKTRSSDKVRLWQVDYKALPLDGGYVVLINANEITELEEHKLRLAQSKYYLKSVLDNLFAFVGVLTVDGTLVDANKAPLEAAGIRFEDVYQKKFWDCYWWAYDNAVQDKVKSAVAEAREGRTVRFDIEIRVDENGRMPIDFMIAPLTDQDGQIINLIPSAIDISARALVESQLRESERRFREVVNKTTGGLVIFEESGAVKFVNARAHYYVGSSEEDRCYAPSFFDWFEQKDASLLTEMVTENPSGKENAQVGLVRCDGRVIPVELGISLFEQKDKSYLATISDLSELAKSNAKLSELLSEKTILLNEVHHRVKNNLQVISSLLNLQSRYVDAQTSRHFLMCQQRVRAMALVHQLLYESEDISGVNVGVYIQKLVGLLQDSIGQVADTPLIQKIHFDLPEQPIWLDVKVMVPLGFTVTELITNSLKYGQTESDPLELYVGLTLAGQEIKLWVGDNGPGIEPQAFFESQSLGNKLIESFTKQLRGSLTIEKTNIFMLTLTFPFKGKRA
ncbi:histidine kinase dimerization/phosphoacceptor domain -containing protein [Alteromonas gracilis]|uniref:histidine kinase dimerization/phosphoacceptor domain -containing protein n=1 Tax=Alteromonas gracilis TaxID=1479524 RepID=UPI0037355AB5